MCECAPDGIRNVLVGVMRPTPSADGAAQTFPNVLYTFKDASICICVSCGFTVCASFEFDQSDERRSLP